jgi:hypothetical protein
LLPAALTVAVLLWAPVGARAEAWLPPVPVSPATENIAGSEVAMAGNGDVIAVWSQSTGGMWASIRPAGGSFGAPVQISSGTGTIGSTRPALAVDVAATRWRPGRSPTAPIS